MRTSLAVLAAVAALGCAPRVPDSGAGVGFDSYTEYQRQQARLAGTRVLGDRPAGPTTAAPLAPPPAAAAPPAPPVAAPPSAGGTAAGADAITASDLAAAGIGTAAAGGAAGAVPPAGPAGGATGGAAVGGAAPVIPPVPERTGAPGPNIAAFALSTSHPVGQQMWRRTNLGGQGAAARACARYASPALAQEAFLARGGPERDPLGLDPDGDGYVCGWDPTPFRLVRGN